MFLSIKLVCYLWIVILQFFEAFVDELFGWLDLGTAAHLIFIIGNNVQVHNHLIGKALYLCGFQFIAFHLLHKNVWHRIQIKLVTFLQLYNFFEDFLLIVKRVSSFEIVHVFYIGDEV